MKYQNYLPEVLEGMREYVRLGEGLDPAVQNVWTAVDGFLKETRAASATEEGIGRFERMLGLSPEHSESLEQRRFRVLGVYSSFPPYSMGWLRQKLVGICGADGFLAETDEKAHWLRVGVDSSLRENLTTLQSDLRRSVPANLEIRMSVLYREQDALFCGALLQTGDKIHLEVKGNGTI